MKRTLLILSALFALCSCNAYLDVEQKGTATDDELFKNVSGYRTAVLGVYASLATESMYGNTLTYGFLDDAAMLYPDNGAYSDNLSYVLKHEYKNASVRPTIDAIWSTTYKIISYTNNILEHLEKVNLDASPEYSYFKGEMLGVRAFLHFDLLRMFCSDYQRSPEAGGLPYSTSYDFTNKTVYSLKDTYAKIIEDLKAAEAILTECEITNPTSTPSAYMSYRSSMMNVYAVKAELARVYNAMGDQTNARLYAEEVIRSSERALVAPEQYATVKAYPATGELLWGLSNTNLYTSVFNRFLNTNDLVSKKRYPNKTYVDNAYETVLFSGLSNDVRWNNLFKSSGDATYFTRMLTSEATVNDDPKKLVTGISLLRLPEMYYIAAESWYSENATTAINYLNTVRNKRGLANLEATATDTAEEFKAELYKDRAKEFWGEGQIFFDHKRTQVGFTDPKESSNVTDASDAIFVFPWPDAELEYGGNNN